MSILYSVPLICQDFSMKNDCEKVPFLLKDTDFSAKRCSHKVDFRLTLDKSCIERNESKEKPFKWYEESIIAKTRLPTDEDLHNFAKKVWMSVYIITKLEEDGKVKAFESLFMGGEREGTKTSSKIQDYLTLFSDSDRENLVLTITYDINKWGENRYYAWKSYTKHIHSVLENLRKHFNAIYCWVKESTTKGYPHAHIVISFPKGTIENYDKLPTRRSLRFSKIGRYISTFLSSKVFHLEKMPGKNLKYYLSKYIAKNAKADWERFSDQDYSFTSAERKMLFTLFFIKASQTRRVGFTSKKKMEEIFGHIDNLSTRNIFASANCTQKKSFETPKELSEDERNDMTDVIKTILKEREKADISNFRRLRRYLIKLCTNSPCICEKSLFMIKRKHIPDDLPKDIQSIKQLSLEKKQYLKSISQNVGCNGCFLSDLHQIVLGELPQYKKFYKPLLSGGYEELFSKEVYADDKKFILNYFYFVNFIISEVFINDMSYKDAREELLCIY